MLVYGKNTLKELELRKIRRIFINKNLKDKELFEYLKNNKIKYELVENFILDKKASGNHQGIVIEIDDYEVKDTQIIETDNEEDYQRDYNQREYDGYDNQGSVNGFYKSISLNNTSLLIILMVAIVLIAIFIMTFD